jgi:hypothetical protein
MSSEIIEIDKKLLDKLSILLYPESLDQISKVITILNEDFTFKGEDLFSLKEISKLFSSKEILFSYLTHLSKLPNPIISINEDFSKCQIIINDKLVYYQFINIPPEYNEERVKIFLDIKDEDISRLYKSSIFWVLISEKEEFNKKFEKFLEGGVTVDKENKKLKYNITSAFMIKKMAKKAIEKRIYNQETENLKSNEKKSDKKEEINKSKKSDDSMSWRKKSDEQDEDYGYGYGYGYGGYNKKNKNKRQRFKSDPNEYQNNNDYYYNNNDYYYNNNKKYYKDKKQNDIEELKEQLDDVKYPIFIKEKYSNKEMLDYLSKIKSNITFNEKNFVNIVDDIIDKEKMKNLELENKKEYEVPKNNPLLNFKKGK